MACMRCPDCGVVEGAMHRDDCWKMRADMAGQATAPTPKPPRVQVLEEGIALTAGDRNKAYGEPVANMQHIADIYNAVTGQNISARDVAVLHQATKQARRYTNPLHRDSYVDGGPYTGIEYECALAKVAPKWD